MLMDSGREVRFIDTAYVEEYLDIYLNAYPAFKALDDECREHYRRKTITDMTQDTDMEFTGLFEDGRLIAIMKIVKFSMNLYGELRPVTGLMSLGVHPLHKKKGAALDMVKFFEAYTEESGAAAGLLLPFNMAFYKKMGYGYGAKMDEYHIPTVSLPKANDLSKLRLLDMSDLPRVLECHSEYVKQNHGALIKFQEEIRDMEGDTQTRRIGYVEGCGAGELKGYIAYRFVCDSEVNYTLNHIEVDELIYQDGAVLKALLGFLRNQADEAQSVVIRTGEPDFYHLLDNAQDLSGNYINFGYLQSNISAVGTMYKVVNPYRFVELSAHRCFEPAEMTVEFRYEDELAHCEDSLKIAFVKDESGECSHWAAAPLDKACDAVVKLKKSDLSSLLMGVCSLGSLVRLGAAQISDSGYLQQLDRLFECGQKPFSNSDF